jgi:hypothetical protein
VVVAHPAHHQEMQERAQQDESKVNQAVERYPKRKDGDEPNDGNRAAEYHQQ